MSPSKRDAAGSGARTAEILAELSQIDCPAFGHRRATRDGGDEGPSPIVLERGEGSRVIDVDGRSYIDLAAGFGSVLLGHGHPRLRQAIAEQSERLIQGLGDVYPSDTKVALMSALAALHAGERPQVLLTQSGADALTAALKTATLATGRHGVVAFDGAYHGLSYGPLPACGFNAAFRQPFAPQLSPLVRFAPYPGVRGASAEASLAMVRDWLRQGDVGAVLVEPLLGRGGCVLPPSGFVTRLLELAHEHGALLIADEIWTGLGRAGALVRSLADGAEADILCFGKGLGGGLPISACVAPAAVMAGWTRGAEMGGGEVVHTSTHAGAPLGCAAALAVLEILLGDDLVGRAASLGERAMNAFWQTLAPWPEVRAVRGSGLMIGVALDSAATAQRAIKGLLERGYLVVSGGIDGAVLTLTPALTIPEEELLGFGPALADTLAA